MDFKLKEKFHLESRCALILDIIHIGRGNYRSSFKFFLILRTSLVMNSKGYPNYTTKNNCQIQTYNIT